MKWLGAVLVASSAGHLTLLHQAYANTVYTRDCRRVRGAAATAKASGGSFQPDACSPIW